MSEDGGHAFPCPINDGMTLRDYFAAQALPAAVDILSTAPGWSEYAAALQAYKLADAMLKVRSE